MAQTVQQYFVQVTVKRGRVMQYDDGSTKKVTDEIMMDDLFCHGDEVVLGNVVEDIKKLTTQLE